MEFLSSISRGASGAAPAATSTNPGSGIFGMGSASGATATGAYTKDPRCPSKKSDPQPPRFDATKTYNVDDLVSWFSPLDNDTGFYKLVTAAPAGTLPSNGAWIPACSYTGAEMGVTRLPGSGLGKSGKKSKSPLTVPQRIDTLRANKTELTEQIAVIDGKITSLQANKMELTEQIAKIDGKITSLQAALDAQEAAIAKAAANAQAAANAVNTVGGRRKSMRKNKGKGKTRGRR